MRKIYSKIEQIAGNVITVKADGVKYGELAEVSSRHGSTLAEVIRLQGEDVYLQAFSGTRGISTGDEVRFLGRPMQVSFSENLLGRNLPLEGIENAIPTLLPPERHWCRLAGYVAPAPADLALSRPHGSHTLP